MDPTLKLWQGMQQALADGYTLDEVNAEIARRTGGQYNTYSDLQERALRIQDDLARGSRGTPGELASTAASGLTLGLGPKIAAGLNSVLFPSQGSYRTQLANIREPIESLRERRPGVAAATEIGSSLATTPFFPGGQAKSFLGAVGRGTATGAAVGALSGVGNAEPGEELAGGVRGGLFGGALGLGFGTLAGIGRLGGPAKRLQSAIDAEGEDRVLQAAREASESGRGRVLPVGALGPYLQSEAEYSATRSPSVFAKYRGAMLRRQAGEAERLTRDVSRITGTPEVGSEAISAARSAEFDPLYEAIDKTAGRIEDPRLANILSRPTVGPVMDEAIKTGMLSDVVESLPSFRQLNELRQVLYAKARSLQNTPGGDKSRMAALFQTARDLESVIEDNVPEFRALQSAYREASRPINVIELARLEAASQGRASPALDRASREARTALLRAFGSSQKYREFMLAVDQERKLAGFTNQVFGGSPTARRMLGEAPIAAEDVAATASRGTAVSAPWAISRLASAAIPKVMRERTARAMAPLLFAPSSDIERVLLEIAKRNAPGKLQFLGQTFLPTAAATGISRY